MTKPHAIITRIIADLELLEAAERNLRELHDRICGPNMHITAGQSPIDDNVHYGILDDLHILLGKHMIEKCMPELMKIAATEKARVKK